jgi:hypothetical protein
MMHGAEWDEQPFIFLYILSLPWCTWMMCASCVCQIGAVLQPEQFGTGLFIKLNWTLWPESVNELCRLSDSCLSAKLEPNSAERNCHMLSVTDLCGRNLEFLDRGRCFLFQVAPQLYSRGWVDPVRDPLHHRKSHSAVNRTRTYGCVASGHTRPEN